MALLLILDKPQQQQQKKKKKGKLNGIKDGGFCGRSLIGFN